MATVKIELQRGSPSEAALEVAKNELRESPKVVKEALLKLRELLKGNLSLSVYFGQSAKSMNHSVVAKPEGVCVEVMQASVVMVGASPRATHLFL